MHKTALHSSQPDAYWAGRTDFDWEKVCADDHQASVPGKGVKLEWVGSLTRLGGGAPTLSLALRVTVAVWDGCCDFSDCSDFSESSDWEASDRFADAWKGLVPGGSSLRDARKIAQ
jgi:hypothetical protein